MTSFASFAGVQMKLLSNTMKRVTSHFIFSSQNPSLFHILSNPTLIFYTTQTSSSTPPPHSHNLTSDELNKINLLLPRLCESNHLHEAIRLIDTALLTNPKPLNSLPLPILIDRLSQEPNMTQSMALLNRLKHNPSSHFSLPYITKLLVNSYFKKRSFKEVMKVVGWVWRIDSPFEMDVGLYRIVVKGFCRSYMTLEALIVVKRMVEDKVVVGDDLRNWIYKSLLREARIKEAKELNAALSCDLGNGKDDDLRRVVALLDQIITKWTD